MTKEEDRSKVFTRRAFILGALQGSLLMVLGGRLAWLQVVEGNKYKVLADNNRINVKLIMPSRGQIVDRFGVPLATNDLNYRALIVPEQAEDIEASLKKLRSLLRLKTL